jgi:hypothetical protein
MKKLGKIGLALGIATLTAGLSAATAHDNDGHGRHEVIRAFLLGVNETPSTSSTATATFRGEIDEDSQLINFTVKYEGLTGPPAVSHLHFGERRVLGGVMIFICGGGNQPACPTGTSGEINGTMTAANVTGPTAQGIDPGEFAKALVAIREGAAYANIHTAKFPAGEIRGQVTR